MAVEISLSGPRAGERDRYVRAVEDAVRAGNTMQAWRVADEAVRKGFEEPILLSHAAYFHLDRGDTAGARDLAEKTLKRAPRDVAALNVLGLSLSKLGEKEQALKTFDAALRAAPGTAALYFNKGCVLEDLKNTVAARAAMERAIALQPAHPEALAHLASLTAQRGAMAKARDYARRALAYDPRQPVALLAVTVADIEDRAFERARQRLAQIMRHPELSPIGLALAHGLMGDALDGLGKQDEAFAAYTMSASIFHSLYRQKAEAKETGWERVERFAEYFREIPRGAWQRAGAKDRFSPVGSHVFLVGFPRSGTTLLENVLGSNPGIETMEEVECLIETAETFIRPRDGLDKLAAASEDELDRYRKAYWRRVKDTGVDLNRPVFIDKMPFYSVVLCAIAKLFPDARILFALRDPRDVVLSCFRRRLAMYELTSLEGAARYYDGVMTLADVYRGMLDMPVYDLRYETVVADFEAELIRVCGFLGVEYSESMRDFTRRAERRPINTPSAAQIARGLYRHGVEQWRAYEAGLKPVLPVLEPWARRFGYAPA